MNMIADDFISTEHRLGAHNYQPLDVVLSRGEGVWSGTSRASAISTASPPIPPSTRAMPPEILAAMVEQAKS